MEKNQVMGALHKFIRQRPQLEFGNYGELKAYRAEVRSIGRDLQDAEALLAAVSWRSITGDDIANAAKDSFSGRLSLVEKGDRVRLTTVRGSIGRPNTGGQPVPCSRPRFGSIGDRLILSRAQKRSALQHAANWAHDSPAAGSDNDLPRLVYRAQRGAICRLFSRGTE